MEPTSRWQHSPTVQADVPRNATWNEESEATTSSGQLRKALRSCGGSLSLRLHLFAVAAVSSFAVDPQMRLSFACPRNGK